MKASNIFSPIIYSLLDTDVYKLYMMQLYYYYYRTVEAEFAFKLRTPGIKQAEIIPFNKLKEQLDYFRELSFSAEELEYLAGLHGKSGQSYFRKEFLEYLKSYRLSPYSLKEIKGNYDIRSSGIVMNSSLWETPTLSINNQLYYDYLPDVDWEALMEEGRRRLDEKIANWRKNPGMRIAEFGTRRRRSRQWQEEVVLKMAQELKDQFVGTSNMYLAMKYGFQPIGTMAHELFMIGAGVNGSTDEGIKNSVWTILRQYHELYPDLSTALPDTFGTDFFFREIPEDLAVCYTDYRHDSDDPIRYANKVLAFIRERSLDLKTKGIPFSDGLTGESSIRIYKEIGDKIRSIYAPGTDATCDFGLNTLSIVMKAVYATGGDGIRRPLVKLSDNLAKATGEDAREIDRYKKIFGYKTEEHEFVACKS